jgi:hypothetical protein
LTEDGVRASLIASVLKEAAPCSLTFGSPAFTVPTVTFHTLFVFFFITHDRQRLIHLNVTAHPTADWIWRQLIAATPWGNQPQHLLRDRDRSYGAAFIPRAARVGIQTILTPVQAPKANAIDERHLRLILMEYAAHYNAARPHRARPPAAQRSACPGRATKRWPAQGKGRTGSPASRI